jgi:hypothetical protein
MAGCVPPPLDGIWTLSAPSAISDFFLHFTQ